MHEIEKAADAVERELADLRAKLAQSEADKNGLVELVKATHENNEALRAKLAVAVARAKVLEDTAQALGAMPEGYCFCSANRIGDDSKTHEPECADLRAALNGADNAC